jgi:hypothetical protein
MSIGCCGRPTANLEALAYSADLYPRSTKAGQKARVRLALAMVERRGIAQGRPDIVAKARRGLAGLGTVADDSRRAAVAAAISTVRAGRERRDDASGRVIDQLQARHDARIGRDVETVLTALQAAVSLAEAVVRGEAQRELTNAANEGRPVNYTLADAGKVLAWFRWLFGGAFPSDVAEGDLRLFASVYETVLPMVTAALTGGKLAAAAANNTGLRDALIGIENYLASMSRTVRGAVAALPAPAAPPAPPAPPPGGGFVVGPATGIRCPDGQVGGGASGERCHYPCAPPSYWDGRQCTTPPVFVQPSTPKSSSSVVLALPAALVLWYLFK